MRMLLEFGGDVILNRAFDRDDILAHGHARTIAEPKNMGVDSLGRHMPPHVQHHIGGFAPHARQTFKSRTGRGHLTIIVIDQNLAQFDDILGLIAIEADGFDMLYQTLFAQIEHLLRRIGDFEQGIRGLVHALIGRLRRKRDGHHQSIGVDVIKFAFRLGLGGLEPGEDLFDRVILKLFHGRSNALSRRFEQVVGDMCAIFLKSDENTRNLEPLRRGAINPAFKVS